MNTFVIASLRNNAGKTSFIVGLNEVMGKKAGYMKPFGDRLLYSKKRLWDYDAALMANLYDIEAHAETMSIGFDHSKLRYMYNEESTRKRVQELAKEMGEGKDILFVEGGKAISYGQSVYLDSLSLARYLGSSLVFVTGGDDDTILDDIMFVQKNVDLSDVTFAGVIINKVQNIEDFTETYIPEIKRLGIPVLGVIPHYPDLTYFSLRYLADKLFAKVLTCEDKLDRTIKNIFIGAMSGNVAMQKPLFKKEDKLIITGGDRTDMILAATESQAAGIVLTNNILPPSNIIAKVEETGTPMLLVTPDTYQIGRQIERMVPLMTKEDTEKVAILKNLVAENVDVKALTG